MKIKIFVILVVLSSVRTFFISDKPNWREDPKWIDAIKIYFHSPIRKNKILVSNEDSMFPGYNTQYPLKILIHGWVGDSDHISIAPIRNAYLGRGGTNLVLIDWKLLASQYYDISRSLLSKASVRMAEILDKWMRRMCIKPETVHILGHSLGAHIAGNIGKYFNGTLGRITGLDPALPQFNSNPVDGLKPSDAAFVDVINTCAGVLGNIKPRGHINFYPNRGFPSQPGCLFLDMITIFSCSHYRAVLLYAESIVIPYSFIAASCDKESLFHSIKKCKPKYHVNGVGNITFMGEMVSQDARGIYFLETNAVAPFGRGNYLI